MFVLIFFGVSCSLQTLDPGLAPLDGLSPSARKKILRQSQSETLRLRHALHISFQYCQFQNNSSSLSKSRKSRNSEYVVLFNPFVNKNSNQQMEIGDILGFTFLQGESNFRSRGKTKVSR